MHSQSALLSAPTPADPGYEALVAQGLALLPAHAPAWTNHNPSDPGITLLELLAYFTDLMQYRLGRVGSASQLEFLRLLRGGDLAALDGSNAATLRTAIETTLDEIAQIDCAVTAQDHERLATQAVAALPWGAGARVRCLPQTDLERAEQPDFDAGQDPGHVSVVLFPPGGCPAGARGALLEAVRQALEPRRLLTSRLHVMAPRPVYLGLRLWATAAIGADPEALAQGIAQALGAWQSNDPADPAPGTLALAELADLAAAVDGVEGIDGIALLQTGRHLSELQGDDAAIGVQIGLHSTLGRDSRLGAPPPLTHQRLQRDADGALAAVSLRSWEQPHVVLRPADVVWLSALGERRSLR